MVRMKARTVLFPFGLACVACVLWAERAHAQFPAQGTDTIPSLGKFTIEVNSTFVPAVQSLYAAGDLPGYTVNVTAQGYFLTSPLLSDSTTEIARSNTITFGSSQSISGVPVGSPPYTNVAASNLTLLPPGYNPTNGTDQVYTAIQNLNLVSGTTSVTAGQAITGGPNMGVISPGAVTSNSPSGMPANDFPAKSFFDIFVDIHVGYTGGSIDLYNTTPLLVTNDDITSLPPKVIYTHTASSTTDLLVNDPGQPDNGAFFGTVMVSGHGANYSANNPTDVSSFNQAYTALLQQAGVIPEPSSWIMFVTAGLMVSGYARWGRRRRTGN